MKINPLNINNSKDSLVLEDVEDSPVSYSIRRVSIFQEVRDKISIKVKNDPPSSNKKNIESAPGRHGVDAQDRKKHGQPEKLEPRCQITRPNVEKKGETMKRPKRPRNQRPSTFFIQSPFNPQRRVSEYTLQTSKHGRMLGHSITVICCFLFIYEFSLGKWRFAAPQANPAIGPSGNALIHAGAKDTPLILAGEWWRLISPSFLHAGIIHLAINMAALQHLMHEMEPVHGWKPLLVIYVVSGVFSTGCSALFLPHQIMVGSSGAIFGIMGAQFSDLVQNWTVFFHPVRHLVFIIIVTSINLALGFMPFLDNFAHVGGTVMGLLCGLMLLNQRKVDHLGFHRPSKWYQIMVSCFSAIMVVLFFVTIFSLLYTKQNPYNFCPACEHMSCMPFPPRSTHAWWDCSICGTVGFTVIEYVNGTFILQCPFEKKMLVGNSASNKQPSQAFFLNYCKSHC